MKIEHYTRRYNCIDPDNYFRGKRWHINFTFGEKTKGFKTYAFTICFTYYPLNKVSLGISRDIRIKTVQDIRNEMLLEWALNPGTELDLP